MKKFFSIALFFLSLNMFSQVPQAINYQGVARNAGGTPIVGPIAVRVEIHQGAPNGAVVCSEVFHVSTNPFGIFDLKIGTVSPGQFSNIAWGNSTYFVGVAIDPAGGSNFGTDISNQQLMSVPYALYAEKAGNAVPSDPVSITASPNATITSPGTNSYNINIPNYVAGSNVTITAVGGNNFQVNAAGGSSTATPLGPWVAGVGNVQLLNPGDNVGIGAAPVFGKLDVIATTTTGVFVSSPANAVFAVTGSSSPTNSAIYGNNQGGNTSGPGVTGVSSASLAAGVSGLNTGPGPGVYGVHQNNINSPTGHGVYGETNSSSPTSAGVIGVNNGPGPGVYGYQGSASGGAGVWGIGNSTSAAAVHGIHNNGYASVFGDNGVGSNSASAYGVWGRTNSTNSIVSGVYGQNMGAGHGVMGLSSANSFSTYGVVGRNIGLGEGVHGDANTTSNIIPAIGALNSGMGPALKGSLPVGTFAGASNAALMLENGHLWASQVTPPTLSVPSNFSSAAINGASLVPGSNDVRGMITLTVQSSTAPWSANGYVDITLNFNKPYMAGGPWVVITKFDQSPMLPEIINMTTTFVTFRFKNPSASPLSPTVSVLRFNYMVMQ